MTQLQPYLYAVDGEMIAEKALIILPEIYGVQDFTRELAQKVQSELGWTGYVLDHFYAVTGKVQTFDYSDTSAGMAVMQQMTGEAYLSLLGEAIDEVMACQPGLVRLAIWGFCFGGKLAYLSGVDTRVTDIVSFYGGASLAPDFYDGKSVVEALTQKRMEDKNLRILAAFGKNDEMIPALDVENIRSQLEQAKITREVNTYPAGHAFFNEDRKDRYVQVASDQAWQDIIKFLSDSSLS
jgi:carboxymethylenebutenolidase